MLRVAQHVCSKMMRNDAREMKSGGLGRSMAWMGWKLHLFACVAGELAHRIGSGGAKEK
jgi:hypothetical protein